MDTLLLTGNNTLMALLRRLLAASNFHAAVKIRRTHEILINKSLWIYHHIKYRVLPLYFMVQEVCTAELLMEINVNKIFSRPFFSL